MMHTLSDIQIFGLLLAAFCLGFEMARAVYQKKERRGSSQD